MGTLVIRENITLDGVIEDPTGDDGFSRGGWFSRISEEDRQGWAEIESAQAFDAAAELYGRRTYEWLTTRWATREALSALLAISSSALGVKPTSGAESAAEAA